MSDEVYELLKRSRLPGESFSTLIRRRMHKPKLSEIAGKGTLSRGDWRRTNKSLKKAERITARKPSRIL